jgi:uncharacterized protein YegL
MRDDLTDITLVVDRSGSMQAIRADAEGGVNALIEEQRKEPGEAALTLVQFDTEYEVVHRGVPIGDVPAYSLVPRGMTALLDAVGRAINETDERIRSMPEEDRPGLVLFVINTDGLENSSQEFTKDQIKEMIEEQQKENDWHFTFLGANQDSFAEARAMGIQADGVADYAADKVGASYRAASSKLARMRGQKSRGEEVLDAFTPEERDSMK